MLLSTSASHVLFSLELDSFVLESKENLTKVQDFTRCEIIL